MPESVAYHRKGRKNPARYCILCHREKAAVWDARFYKKKLVRNQEWRRKNRDKVNAISRKYYAKNKDVINARNRYKHKKKMQKKRIDLKRIPFTRGKINKAFNKPNFLRSKDDSYIVRYKSKTQAMQTDVREFSRYSSYGEQNLLAFVG